MAKKETKTNKKENKKKKKSFFKDFKAELKKVIWPTPKQLLNNTVAVVTIVLITAAIVFVLDLAFETVNKHGVNKVKEILNTTSENTVVDENATSDKNTIVYEDEEEADEISVEESEENTEIQEQTTEENTENNAE